MWGLSKQINKGLERGTTCYSYQRIIYVNFLKIAKLQNEPTNENLLKTLPKCIKIHLTIKPKHSFFKFELFLSLF